jgi:hypothetical protein
VLREWIVGCRVFSYAIPLFSLARECAIFANVRMIDVCALSSCVQTRDDKVRMYDAEAFERARAALDAALSTATPHCRHIHNHTVDVRALALEHIYTTRILHVAGVDLGPFMFNTDRCSSTSNFKPNSTSPKMSMSSMSSMSSSSSSSSSLAPKPSDTCCNYGSRSLFAERADVMNMTARPLRHVSCRLRHCRQSVFY